MSALVQVRIKSKNKLICFNVNHDVMFLAIDYSKHKNMNKTCENVDTILVPLGQNRDFLTSLILCIFIT